MNSAIATMTIRIRIAIPARRTGLTPPGGGGAAGAFTVTVAVAVTSVAVSFEAVIVNETVVSCVTLPPRNVNVTLPVAPVVLTVLPTSEPAADVVVIETLPPTTGSVLSVNVTSIVVFSFRSTDVGEAVQDDGCD